MQTVTIVIVERNSAIATLRHATVPAQITAMRKGTGIALDLSARI
jgi:hypothetical protein